MSEYRPHAGQAAFHAEAQRFAIVAAGVRSGKTHAAAREALRRIYRDRAVKRGALRYWCAAPTYAVGKVQQRELFEALGMPGSPLVVEFRKSERELVLRDDIFIEFKTTERPENLVAAGLDGLWVDEAARVKAEAWLGGLRMRLSDRQGWAVFSTTPLGRNWFFRHLVQPAQNGADEFSLHTWTTADNTCVPALVAEVAKARATLPATYFRREYEASFDAFVGQVFAEFDAARHVVGADPARVAETRYGVDWGYRHPGAIVCLQRDRSGRWVVVEEIVASGTLVAADEGESWVSLADELVERRGPGVFYCDPSQPASIRSFRQAGLSARPADNDVAAGIQTVARALHPAGDGPRLVVHRRCVHTVEQLLTYRWDEAADGERPHKENDDACDALRYALHTARHTPAFW